MADVLAIGAAAELSALALAGAHVVAADEQEQVVAAWQDWAGKAEVVVLTRSARAALGDRVGAVGPGTPLVVVLP